MTNVPPDADRETFHARRRLPNATYAVTSFDLDREGSADDGERARFIYRVFDPDNSTELEHVADGQNWLVRESEKGRSQVRLLVAREASNVKELWIQRVATNDHAKCTTLLNLDSDDAHRLVQMLRGLDSLPIEGRNDRYFDDELLNQISTGPPLQACRRSR